jgi:DNA-binding transcriptional LysR family regulator
MVDPYAVLPLLQRGEVDLALCNEASYLDLPDLEGIVLFEEPMLIALPEGHRLASRKRLKLTELAKDRWMLGTAESCPDADRFTRACHTAGFEPDIAFNNDDYTAILGFVAAGVGVAPIPEMVLRRVPDGVVTCVLQGIRVSRPICAVVPGGYQSRPAKAMLKVLQDVSEWWQAGAAPREPVLAA